MHGGGRIAGAVLIYLELEARFLPFLCRGLIICNGLLRKQGRRIRIGRRSGSGRIGLFRGTARRPEHPLEQVPFRLDHDQLIECRRLSQVRFAEVWHRRVPGIVECENRFGGSAPETRIPDKLSGREKCRTGEPRLIEVSLAAEFYASEVAVLKELCAGEIGLARKLRFPE